MQAPQQETQQQKIPAIFTDLDGVLIHLKHAVPRSADTIKFLKTPLNQIDPEKFPSSTEHLPFVGLTNAGNGTEHSKAEALNTILGLQGPQRISKEEVIMNFTPLRPILSQYKERLVLLGGLGEWDSLAKDIGLKRYITDEEYCSLFPVLNPSRGRPESGEAFEELQKKISERLGITDPKELEEPFQIHAIFMLHDPNLWDDRIQIICDLLSTSDGRVAQFMPEVGPADHIPVYCTHNDILWTGEFRINRMTFGCFNEALRASYKLIYKRELNLNIYGKPCLPTFEYAKKHLAAMTDLPISNYYMIGDNPRSDIRGGNVAGWITILVKTGVFKWSEEHQNDHDDPATYVVDDFMEAIKLIYKLEGIKCDL